MTAPVILWFRQDLRLADNRALSAAAASGAPVLPVYILDDDTPGIERAGGASRWWLHHSLAALGTALEQAGSRLILRQGKAADELRSLAVETKASAVYCSRCYEPSARQLETELHRRFEADGIAFKRFGGTLLAEPEDLKTQAGDPFKVYSPFWRALSSRGEPAKPLPAPTTLKTAKAPLRSDTLASLKLLPTKPDWARGFSDAWQPGEIGAHEKLDRFLESALKGYKADRNRPDLPGSSRLSPHLHFGEITPAQCWHAACGPRGQNTSDEGCETFRKELVWREFSYHLLHHWPTLPSEPFRPEFASFPWQRNPRNLKAWQQGLTGYPLVDAGMRELWVTGWLHNRVRMVVASFLIKHLMIDWRDGEAWFWDTLVDADLANNAASWQWVAGSGADAAPYFRIFNPVKQGQTFDPAGDYVRRWIPELAQLDIKVLHAPWTATATDLAAAGVTLGETYPHPIVEHGEARDRALAAFQSLKGVSAGPKGPRRDD